MYYIVLVVEVKRIYCSCIEVIVDEFDLIVVVGWLYQRGEGEDVVVLWVGCFR